MLELFDYYFPIIGILRRLVSREKTKDCDDVCRCGFHQYEWVSGFPWCKTCQKWADIDICKLSHPAQIKTENETNK